MLQFGVPHAGGFAVAAKTPPADRGNHGAVTREEFAALVERVEQNSRDLQLQFRRIAQIQAELDRIAVAWTKRSAQRRR